MEHKSLELYSAQSEIGQHISISHALAQWLCVHHTPVLYQQGWSHHPAVNAWLASGSWFSHSKILMKF